MDITTQKRNAKQFIQNWQNRGHEKQDSQSFWLQLLRDVLGVEEPEQFIKFEKKVQLSHESFIDGYIDQTHVMIEQKGSNKDLDKPIRQSSGELLTPFQQAQRYAKIYLILSAHAGLLLVTSLNSVCMTWSILTLNQLELN